jgi:hypothetical protein
MLNRGLDELQARVRRPSDCLNPRVIKTPHTLSSVPWQIGCARARALPPLRRSSHCASTSRRRIRRRSRRVLPRRAWRLGLAGVQTRLLPRARSLRVPGGLCSLFLNETQPPACP